MHKKLFISFAILISLIFSFTICFANDGGNMVKDAADTCAHMAADRDHQR